MSDFRKFSDRVEAAFQRAVSGDRAFVAGVDGDELYALYLASFPPGTDPIFRKATEHSCSCCRQFIRRAGNVVRVDTDGTVRTAWDEATKLGPYPYDAVAWALRKRVLEAGIVDVFRVGKNEASFGAAVTRSLEDGKAVSWEHLCTGPIPDRFRVDSPDQARGDYRTTVQVFSRGLSELDAGAVDTVLSLIGSNALYRGEEHRKAVEEFHTAQQQFLSIDLPRNRDVFAWAHAHGPAARFRNTVIGTLVQDLSEGMDVERAVAAFEAKVAPQNYKRTTAVITPGMVKKAMETIQELGLEPALERRFAAISDVSVGDVLWVDGRVRPAMKGGLADELMQQAQSSRRDSVEGDEDRAEPIALDSFVKDVLPEATGVEVMLKGEHLGNLVSLTAPVHPEPKQLFRWDNDFAWSYGGNVADSIRERVKKAGGKVEGALLRVSLSWFNYDDLDLHIVEPKRGGYRGVEEGHIYFRNKIGYTGGVLDVDMNAASGQTRQAVENVVWSSGVPNGAYRVVVNNFNKRETADAGFVIEVECGGRLSHYSYNRGVRDKQDVHVVTLHMKGGQIERVEPGDDGISAANVSQERWGLTTERYARVDAVTLSPNHWGKNSVGNRHTFFFLEGARNDEPTRGIYNEFLHPRLEQHRKVFEVIGEKTKCRPTDGQLSGLGFSSTKRDSFLARVQVGKRQRIFSVQVGT